MILVVGITFENAIVALDGRHFLDCSLRGCVLEYSGGDLTLERTEVQNCRPLLRGPAGRTYSLLSTLGLLPAQLPRFIELTADGAAGGLA